MAFKPALLVVDMQNDYCSPEGGHPVSGDGRDLVAPIKQLLSMPGFAMRITTLSECPENHKAMAHNVKGATPHETYIDFPNPKKGMGHKTIKQMSLKKVCLKGTWGSQLVDGLQESDFDLVVRRNRHPDSWGFSALKDVHGNNKHELHPEAISHHLGDELTSKEITHVFCVGTAGDYCVSHTAMDIASAGFKTYVVEDVTMSFDNDEAWPAMKKELKAKDVGVVMMNGPEVGRVRASGGQGKQEKQENQGNQGKMIFHGNFNGPVFFGYSAEQSQGLIKTL